MDAITIVKLFNHKNLIGKEKEIIDLYYVQGAPILYIADRYKCSCDTITKWFRANRLNTRTLDQARSTMGKFRVENNSKFGDFKFTHPKLLGKDEEIRKLYVDEGYGTSEICDLFGVQSMTISTWLKRNGIHIRTPKEARNIERRYEKQKTQVQRNVSEDEVDRICSLYAEGYGAKYISKLLKYDSCVIFRILDEQKIHIRGQKEAANTSKNKEMSATSIFKNYGSWENYRDWQSDKFEEKYGVRNPMQVKKYFTKNQDSGLRFKTSIIDGIEIIYQGYELRGIYKLLSEGYLIEDIKIGRDEVPTFRYILNGKTKVYYPDIFIPKDNRIIEVKSKWTYEKELEKNLLKKQSVINSGYLLDFYIMVE